MVALQHFYVADFQGAVFYTKCCFPVMHFFYVRLRTECSEHVNSFIDAY